MIGDDFLFMTASQVMTEYNKSEFHLKDMQKAWSDPLKRKRMSQGMKNQENKILLSNRLKKEFSDGTSFRVQAFKESRKRLNSDKERKRASLLKSQDTRIVKIVRQILKQNLQINEDNWDLFRNKSGSPSFKYALNKLKTIENLIEFSENYNLQVISLEREILNEPEDVYCLTVKNKHHTFMLANGLITKNCEGTSAGSNLISQRDPMIHAVLPLRGKPRNIMEESVETILNNLEMRSLVNALGTGLMKHERPELCRYGKIIIASDADCDGMQISSLVLAALCYLVPNTVLSGKVYLMTAPLYGIINQNVIKFETDSFDRYYLTEDIVTVCEKEKPAKLVKIGDKISFENKEYEVKSISKFTKDEFIPVWESYLSPTIKLKRYKGLGSMSPKEAKISLLSDKRKLQTITGTQIDKVMKLVGETEFKKLLMKTNEIIDWQC